MDYQLRCITLNGSRYLHAGDLMHALTEIRESLEYAEQETVRSILDVLEDLAESPIEEE